MTERGNEVGCRTIVEPPVGSHAISGIVERAVQTVEGQIRVMKIALDLRPVWASRWMLERIS